jgi:hypothetical protein
MSRISPWLKTSTLRLGIEPPRSVLYMTKRVANAEELIHKARLNRSDTESSLNFPLDQIAVLLNSLGTLTAVFAKNGTTRQPFHTLTRPSDHRQPQMQQLPTAEITRDQSPPVVLNISGASTALAQIGGIQYA